MVQVCLLPPAFPCFLPAGQSKVDPSGEGCQAEVLQEAAREGEQRPPQLGCASQGQPVPLEGNSKQAIGLAVALTEVLQRP